MATALQVKNDRMVTTQYGGTEEVLSLARRVKAMVPGGNRLTDSEAQALAQVSLVTNCNPFIGEIWYIPGGGPMIGIKGARRHGNEQIKEAGGPDAYWSKEMLPISGDEAGYKGDMKDLAAAYKCIITDSVSLAKFQKLFLGMVVSLREAGSKDPVGEARELVGKRPEWVGYGFTTISEKSKMNKDALARKRAEADALKQRFDIPFGAEVAAGDDHGDWLDAEVAEEPPNGHKPSEQEKETAKQIESAARPYAPEQLKERIQLFANENQRKNRLNATQSQRGLVAGVLNECFAGDPDSDKIRHSVLKFLTGYDSVGKDGAPGIYVLALLDWLQPEKDSGGAYHADEMASKEARAVWTQALKDAGQMEMGV